MGILTTREDRTAQISLLFTYRFQAGFDLRLGISTSEKNVETKDTIEAVKRELVDVARATDGKLRVVDAEEAAELAGAMSFGAQNSVDGGDRMKNGGIATPLLLVIVSNPLTSEFASPARLLIKVLL